MNNAKVTGTTMEFSETQKTIAKCLLSHEKTLEEIRQETKYSPLEINEALKGLLKANLVEKTQNDKYKLIDYIMGKVKQQKGVKSMAKSGEKEVFRANLIIEGAADAQEVVEKQISLLESKLRKEPYEFAKIEKSTAEKIENTYCMFLDVDVSVPRFKDLIYLIINYGPSSVELLEPESVELSLHDAQELLNTVVSTVHYYTTYILQMHMQKNAQKNPPATEKKERKAEEKIE